MPGKSLNWKNKNHLGTLHWSQTQAWKIYKYDSIFSIPEEELRKYSWVNIPYGEPIEFPVIRIGYDKDRNGQNLDNYWTVIIDWEYILERQARFFASLGWSGEEITQFYIKSKEWLVERTAYLIEKAIEQQAEEMAKTTGNSKEHWLAILKQQPAEEKEVENIEEDVLEQQTLKGTLERLGREYFLSIGYTDSVSRYKLSKSLVNELGNIESLLGTAFLFEYSTENPPRSRGAKGWVTSIQL